MADDKMDDGPEDLTLLPTNSRPVRMMAPLTVEGTAALILALTGREPSPEVRARIERRAARAKAAKREAEAGGGR